ncbi:hypothetical protein ACTMFR_27620, partial [Escherichia coli]
MPENPASYRVVRTKSYLFNKAVSTRTHANGPADAGRTRLLFAAEIFPMNVFSRYLIRHLFLGFAAAAGLL